MLKETFVVSSDLPTIMLDRSAETIQKLHKMLEPKCIAPGEGIRTPGVQRRSDGSTSIDIETHSVWEAKFGLAHDVFLRTDDGVEHAAGRIMVGEKHSSHGIRSVLLPLELTSVDVIFRPSTAWALRTVTVDRMVDHEFVYEDLRVYPTRY